MQTEPVTAPTPTTAEQRPPRYGLEVIAVLGVSLGMSGIYALLYLIRAEITVKGGISATTATVVSGSNSDYPWLDLLDGLADVLHGLFPAMLALVLLAREPGLRAIGWDTRRLGHDVLVGVGFTALIGLPGLALVWTAHQLGLNASLQVVDLPDVWYRVPLLLLSAAQNGILEEIVVVAYLLTRLRQMGWSDSRALTTQAVLRGSYHLYQGFGGFLGNLVMGLIFGWWFQRTRRVLPLVFAHTLLDAFSFVGYIYLHEHVSWI
ncbi:CAAX prenyl protease-like protein [Jatrophihabitans sp. GAS493]|nr:CAAX prenyl protease-like protein [Jatrophihabitans sp. GAS493]